MVSANALQAALCVQTPDLEVLRRVFFWTFRSSTVGHAGMLARGAARAAAAFVWMF